MTPSARIQATIEILGELAQTARPADRFLRDWFRARRYAGSGDRAAIAERVFFILRHRASLAFRMRSDTPRALAIGALGRDGLGLEAITQIFSGEAYAPAPLTEAERSAFLNIPRVKVPTHVSGDFPAFLEPELARAFGANLLSEMSALNGRASIDLRVNPLKAERNAVCLQLKSDGFDAEPTCYAPFGIRIPTSESGSRLSQCQLYLNGAFEFQDEAAQIAAHLVGAMPGQSILDLAAGAGGKSLAIAADMQNEGSILAWDIRESALEELKERAQRAGVSIISTDVAANPSSGAFDAVFVDAPCSGSGVWRRQPDAKWRLTPERLQKLTTQQDALLAQAAKLVRPNGALLYATCSVLPCENEDRISALLGNHGEFVIEHAAQRWARLGRQPVPGMDEFFQATPLRTATDGFFCAVLVRRAML